MARLDALIMPSAIAPSEKTPHQALVNPKVRLRQTVQAVSHWVRLAEKEEFQVLVADNTNFGEIIRDSLPKRVANSKCLKVIDVPLIDEKDIRRGKGAGETSTLISALTFLDLPGNSNVAKVNARYRTSNGLFLVQRLSDDFDFAAWPRRDLLSVDTTFFVGKASFLTDAFDFVYRETDDLVGNFVELLYSDYSIRNSSCNFERFDFPPAVIAQSGSTGAKTHFFGEARVVSMVVKLRSALILGLSKFGLIGKIN